MINYFYGNLFELFDTTPVNMNGDELHFIIHGCNAQGRMGTGFAKELRERFPDAYKAYNDAYVNNNNRLELGTVINHPVHSSLVICNAITQQFYGYDGKKYVSYDAIDTIFEELNKTAKTVLDLKLVDSVHFHFPKIGAGLAGGDWEIIEKIIDSRVTYASKNLYELR